MERSSRFISLSGLSGVFAGVYALIGAWAAHYLFSPQIDLVLNEGYVTEMDLQTPLILIALAVLALSVITAIFFTTRNARKKNQKIWDKRSQRMVWNLAIPLITGGIFIVLLLAHGTLYLVVPGMLIFYGLALTNASKYTLNDIRYLGYSEIFLGLMAAWWQGDYFYYWSLGFGLLHIVYGAAMYWKYER